MKRRVWKMTGLVLAGGVLLQFGGCIGIMMETLLPQLITAAAGAIISGALGGATP